MFFLQRLLLVICLITSAGLHGGLAKVLKRAPVKKHIETQLAEQRPVLPLAVTMIFQNDAPYLKEWIEYHNMLGVQRFYLYNNRSDDNFKAILSPYVNNGLVVLIDWDKQGYDLPSWNAVQCLAYMDALSKARADHVTWLAIIDSDEFLVPRQQDSLVNFLEQYENDSIGSLFVNWVMFGTSYVEKIPADKLLIETLTLNKGYVNCGSKTIVRPDRCDPAIMGGPHLQPMLPNYQIVDLSTDLIQCNHYWSRDEFYLNNVKIPRRIIWGTPPEVCQEWALENNEDTPAGLPILRFVAELRKRMGFDT